MTDEEKWVVPIEILDIEVLVSRKNQLKALFCWVTKFMLKSGRTSLEARI